MALVALNFSVHWNEVELLIYSIKLLRSAFRSFQSTRFIVAHFGTLFF